MGKLNSRTFLCALPFIALAQLGWGQDVPEKAAPLPPAQEELLGELRPKVKLEPIGLNFISEAAFLHTKDLSRVVWMEKNPLGHRVMLNGTPMGPVYKDVKSIQLSADGQHLGFIGKRDANWYVVMDGKELATTYTNVEFLNLSPDGQRVIIAGKRGAKWYVMVNEQEGIEAYDKVKDPATNIDKRQFVFAGQRGGKWYAILDGKEEASAYDDLNGFLDFGFEGNPFAMIAQKAGRWQLIENGNVLAEAPRQFYGAIASADRKHFILVYPTGALKANFFAPDGSTLEDVDDIGAVGFMGNSSHWKAVVHRKGNWHYVIDGVMGPPATALGPLQHTTDGTHWAYAASKEKSNVLKDQAEGFIIFDGREVIRAEGEVFGHPLTDGGLRYTVTKSLVAGLISDLSSTLHGVGDPVLASDGSDLSFSYCVSSKEGKIAVRQNGKDGQIFSEVVTALVPSGATGGLLYIAQREGKICVVRDDNILHEFRIQRDLRDLHEIQNLVSSPGGNRHAFVSTHISSKLQWVADLKLWVDGQFVTQHRCQSIEKLAFTEDETHWACVFFKERPDNRSFVVLDGREGKSYDEISLGSLSFDSTKGATFLARDGQRIVRVTQPWP